MYPRTFDYLAAQSLDEAMGFLAAHEESKVLAGGQSLLPLMKLRLASPSVLVDIGQIPDLSYIRPEEPGGPIAIGALTTHDAVARSDALRNLCPILPEAARNIADQQIRNRGTIGGSCCHADPASDLPPTLRALDARFSIVGAKGVRTVSADEFFVDLFETAVGPREILTRIDVPRFGPRWGWNYAKFNRREGDYPIVGVAIVVRLAERSDAIEEARIGLAAVGSTPLRARAAEKLLAHAEATPTVVAEAAERASADLRPGSDMHGSAEYRRHLVRVLVRRGLLAAVARAQLVGGAT
ncbi:MAG: FAD binding domain-containing protein [Thermoplasmata archaeon]